MSQSPPLRGLTKRRCAKCGQIKIAHSDPDHSDFDAKTRWPDLTPRTFASYCKPCSREYTRQRRGLKGPRQPARTPEQARAHKRETHARRMKSDRQYREQVRRRGRENARIRAALAGRPQRTTGPYIKDKAVTRRVDPGIFLEWFDEWLVLAGASEKSVFAALPIDSKNMRNWRNGRRADVAHLDLILTYAGLPYLLHTLYPDEYHED